LESANKRKENVNLVCVKKKVEDYDQMLQYYIFMITKNKMKDSDVEFKEWWKLQKNILSRNWKTI
jgi:hypothetical protein